MCTTISPPLQEVPSARPARRSRPELSRRFWFFSLLLPLPSRTLGLLFAACTLSFCHALRSTQRASLLALSASALRSFLFSSLLSTFLLEI